MAISFANIPGNIRVPLAYFEIDNSQASTNQQPIQKALLLCTAPEGSKIEFGVPTVVFSADQVRDLCGTGSAAGRQAQRWFQNNASVPLYLLAFEEDPNDWEASSGSITWAGPATGSGTLSILIGGRSVRAVASTGDTGILIAASAAAAINADPTLGVRATGVGAVTNIIALQAGILGGVDVDLNYFGAVGGETMPPGVTATIVDMTGSAGVPDVGDLLSNLGDDPYDFVMCPWFDAVSLNALGDFMNDVTGRWSWASQLYGHCYVSTEQSVGMLSALGNTRNDQHVTILGFYGSHTPHDEWLTAYTGAAAGSLIIDPARPVQALPLRGILAPAKTQRFTRLERQVLYFDGISATNVGDDGTVYIDRLITTYQKNQWGAPDNSYLDVETMYTAAYFNRFMRTRVETKFPRSKLANDGTRFGAGQAIVTPSIIKAEMVAAYGELEDLGLMENAELFAENLIVERNAQDPNRVDVLLPPDFVNQLRIFAALTQFRLQYA
jgi:phage tail sheath gpL-like